MKKEETLNQKIFIENLGCNRRGLDAARLANFFILNENQIISDYKNADIIIIITCGFTQIKEDESLSFIKKYNKSNGELIVLGCLSAIAPENLKQVFNGKTLSTENFNRIDKFFPRFKVKFKDIPDVNNILKLKNNDKEKQAILRIACGCLGQCSYCAIRFATGELKSKPIENCINEYKSLLEQGFKKFIINAEDCGFYGKDINSSLSELLEQLSLVDDEYKVEWIIQTLNPQYIIKNKEIFLPLIKQGKITKIKCDVQSGNPRILRLMRRFSNINAILEIFSEFKKINPKIFLISHFIVGFPSETEEEFQNTLEIMEKLNLDQYEVFSYSDRKGTIASRMKNKVHNKEIKIRLKKLRNYFENRRYNSLVKPNKVYLYKNYLEEFNSN